MSVDKHNRNNQTKAKMRYKFGSVFLAPLFCEKCEQNYYLLKNVCFYLVSPLDNELGAIARSVAMWLGNQEGCRDRSSRLAHLFVKIWS